MYIIKKKFDKKDIQYINNIHIREVCKDNRLYEEHYKVIYEITILSGYVIYKEIGEIIMYYVEKNIYIPKPFLRKNITFENFENIQEFL